MQQPGLTEPGIALAPPLHELRLLDAPPYSTHSARRRLCTVAGRRARRAGVAAGVGAEVGGQGGQSVHGVEQGGRGATGEVERALPTSGLKMLSPVNTAVPI